MLLELTEDCFEEVLKKLNLTDHLVLSQAHPILHDVIGNKFKRKFNSVLQLTNYWQQTGNEFSVPPYLRDIMDNETESIKLDTNELYDIKEALEGLEFTKIKSITIEAEKIEKESSLEMRYLLPKLFPNLRSLKIKGNFRDHLICIKNIKEIEVLSKPQGIVWNLLYNLNLKKLAFHEELMHWFDFKGLMVPMALEDLTLCMSDYDVIDENLQLNHVLNLRKLTIKKVTEDIELSLYDRHFYRSIDSIAFNTKYCPSIFARFSNLQRLLIVNDNGKTLNEFCKLDIEEWHKIEEILYIQTSDDSNIENQKTNLLYMVNYCKGLKTLDISGSKFGMDFIESLMELLTSQLRTEQLFLNCFNTQIPKGLMCPEIKFSFQEQNYDLPDESEIQIELNKEKNIMETICYVKQVVEYYRINNSELDVYMEFLVRTEEECLKTVTELSIIEATAKVTIGPLNEYETFLREKISSTHNEILWHTKAILERFWHEETIF